MTYTNQLRDQMDTLTSIATKYGSRDGRRVEWLQAFAEDPALEPKLLHGPGPRSEQIKRLSAAWVKLRPRPATKQTRFNGKPSLSSIFDDNRAELERIIRENKDNRGRVNWVKALDANPQVADAIGYTQRDPRDKIKLIAVLGFWYRSRGKPRSKLVASLQRASDDARERVSQVPPAERPPVAGFTGRPLPQPVARFCPHCGEDLGSHTLAVGIISSMSASGLTPTQIMQTLTQAAGAVARLTTNHETQR